MKYLKEDTQLPPIVNKTNLALDASANMATTNNGAKNLSKVLVLTKNDLDRIAGHLNQRQAEEQEALDEKNRKRELYLKSQALTKTWNNTIHVSFHISDFQIVLVNFLYEMIKC